MEISEEQINVQIQKKVMGGKNLMNTPLITMIFAKKSYKVGLRGITDSKIINAQSVIRGTLTLINVRLTFLKHLTLDPQRYL